MKFTVLGASGVIGRALSGRLREQGHEVLALGRQDHWDHGANWGHAIYAIGLTADFRCRPHDTVRAHVGLLSEVLQRARFETLLYVSSTRVYLGGDQTQEESPLRVAPANPSDLYNLSKLLGEALCLNDPRAGVRVARLSNVVGGDDSDSENFIPTLQRQAHAGCIRPQTALASAKDYIHIEDVLQLLPQIPLRARQRLYKVASGRLLTHGQWAEHLRTVTGCHVEVAAAAPAVQHAAIDVGRIRTEFGFVPRSPLAAVGRPAAP